jgi:phosphoribosylformylglycinamidine cyclo-ligase
MAKYEKRGVSPHKPDVQKAIENIDQGVFPGAFCKAVPDILSGSKNHCFLLHADGAGTKSALAYMHYRKHGNPNVFEGIAQDSLVMNIDDLLCVGATGPFIFSNTIGRNAKLITGDIVEAIINGYENFSARLRDYGIIINSCGGETADVGDLVRTVIVDSTVATRLRYDHFIDCSKVVAGHDIIGLASFGKAIYEDTYNSGISTNGFTSARHEILNNSYKDEFPETYAPEILDLTYTGKFKIDDQLSGAQFTVGEALLSPTRTYAPVMVAILSKYRNKISAIYHNSGGGQTKCINFGKDIRYIKDNLFPSPPIFTFLKEQTHLSLREMYRVFNMGHRLEIICVPSISGKIMDLCQPFGVEARVVGRTEHQSGKTSLTIVTNEGPIDFARE